MTPMIQLYSRGDACLSFVITNFCSLYSPPTTVNSLGSSDHSMICLVPNPRSKNRVIRTAVVYDICY